MKSLSRREFSRLVTGAAAATAVAPLGLLNARMALAQSCNLASFAVPGFGPISPVLPNNTSELVDVPTQGNLVGVPLIALPALFQYTAISIRGQQFSNGTPIPGAHDGMAVFQGRGGHYILVRNHELSISTSAGCLTANGKQYDPFAGTAAGTGGGGTSTVIVDRNGRVVEDYLSLGGTIRNCAGGPTPWGSWLTCEENVTIPSSDARATKRHGYNFEVPSQLGEAVDPIPLGDAQPPVQDLTIEELEHLSGRGQAHASYELFRRAWECQSIVLQLDSLSDDVSVGKVSTGEAERTLSVLDHRRETCTSHGIRKGRYRDWLRLAAQQGNQEAMVQFASFPPWETGDALELIARSAEIETFKAEAMGFLSAAASSGNADALNTLGHAYHDGTLVAADPVRAAAYMRAASLSGLVTSADVLFNNWTSGMTPDERATVEAFAREILLDCCSG